MPINPAIAMSFQAPKFEDPMNNLIKMEQIKAYQQNALAKQLEAEVAQESLGQQRGLRNYLAGLEPGASPDMNMLARFGKAGQEYGQTLTEAEKTRLEMQTKLYKDIHLPRLAQAKTVQDVNGWYASMQNDPRLKGFLTEEGRSMLPKTDEEVRNYVETTLVPFSDIYKRETQKTANQARLDAAARTAAATREAAQIRAGAPTDDMREYDKAVSGGFKGSFEDWMSKNAPKGSATGTLQEYDRAVSQGYKGTLVDFKKEFGKDIYQETLDRLAAQRDIQAVSTAEGAKGMLDYIGYKVDEEGNETNEIAELIKKSTGGEYQKMGAEALAKFGATTAGREAIGRLSTIADNLAFGLLNGKLGAGISNKDIQLIQNLVGDISNQDKPVGERLASWDQFIKTVKALSQKKPVGRMNLDETSRPSKREPLENIFGG